MNMNRNLAPFRRVTRITAVAIALGLASGTSSVTLAGGAQAADSQHARDVVTIPAGTAVLVKMIDSVDSSDNKIGDHFAASLVGDLVFNGKSVASKGAAVYGKLVEAKPADHGDRKSELRLELTDILINDRFQSIATNDCEVARGSRPASTARKTGAAASAGASVQILTRGLKVHVPSETLLEFRLRQPLTIAPAASGN